jgi:hypothetical protein
MFVSFSGYRENQAGGEELPGDGGFRGSMWDLCEAGLYTMVRAGKSMKLWKKQAVNSHSSAIMREFLRQPGNGHFMDQDKNRQDAAKLERVIEKNQQYLDSIAQDLLQACVGAGSDKEVPPAVIENVLKVYGSMRARLSEIEAVRKLLLRRHDKTMPENPGREKLIADLDAQIKALSARLGKGTPQAGNGTGTPSQRGAETRPASDRWLRINEDSLAFTINARLLDELEYEAPPPPGNNARIVQDSGRGFTLFTLRGPASALDALHPCIRLRQHDIVERFSAVEIRGVLTHLRRTAAGDIKHIFERLLTSRFSDVKCILVGLHSPDQLDEHFLKYLERMAEDMKPGEIRTIDITSHG